MTICNVLLDSEECQERRAGVGVGVGCYFIGTVREEVTWSRLKGSES